MTFVKLGGLYIRPDDVLSFSSLPGNTDKSLVRIRGGAEWRVSMKADAIAVVLNGDKT